MKNSIIRLRYEYGVMWLLSGGVSLLYELDVFPVGTYAGDGVKEYILNTLGVLLSLSSIFFALKMFAFKTIKARFEQFDEMASRRSFVRWSEIRLAILFASVLVNLSIYYVTQSNTGGLCALITLMAACFCWPVDVVTDEKNVKKEDEA